MSYTPTSGALDGRLWKHLAQHRDDEFTEAELASMFGCPVTRVEPSLAAGISVRCFERVRQGRTRIWLYRAGPAFDKHRPVVQLNGSASAAPLPPPSPPVAAKRTRTTAEPLDVATLDVEDNVPMPVNVGRKKTDWPALFERFTKPGLCSSPLPKQQRVSVTSAAKKYFAEKGWKYAVRAVSDTHVRIWRTE